MLCLSRKKGEQIIVGENIVITVHRVSSNRVSIGIEAPKDQRIVRGELLGITPPVPLPDDPQFKPMHKGTPPVGDCFEDGAKP